MPILCEKPSFAHSKLFYLANHPGRDGICGGCPAWTGKDTQLLSGKVIKFDSWLCVKIRVWIGPRWSKCLDRSGSPAFWSGSGVWIGLWVQGTDRAFTFWLAASCHGPKYRCVEVWKPQASIGFRRSPDQMIVELMGEPILVECSFALQRPSVHGKQVTPLTGKWGPHSRSSKKLPKKKRGHALVFQTPTMFSGHTLGVFSGSTGPWNRLFTIIGKLHGHTFLSRLRGINFAIVTRSSRLCGGISWQFHGFSLFLHFTSKHSEAAATWVLRRNFETKWSQTRRAFAFPKESKEKRNG